ncbi:MAG: hypothetical protein ABSG42_09255 [Nitrospirota bacterium]
MKKALAFAAALGAALLFGAAYAAYNDMPGSSDTSSGSSGYSSDVSSAKPQAGEKMTLEGFLIDTKCASGKEAKMAEKNAEQSGTFSEFVKSHSKECVLTCKAGGCSLYSQGRLWKLDKESNNTIISFLRQPGSMLHVKADIVRSSGDKVRITDIHNAM